MQCPTHDVPLQSKPTSYGLRWSCPTAGCTVACWGGSTSTPADAVTRQLRQRCHAAFDPLWKGRKVFRARGNAYDWLARRMGLTKEQCHFGIFQTEQCLNALALIRELIEAEIEVTR